MGVAISFFIFGLSEVHYSIVITAACSLSGDRPPPWTPVVYMLVNVLAQAFFFFAGGRTMKARCWVQLGAYTLLGFLGLFLLAWSEVGVVRLLGVILASVTTTFGRVFFLGLCARYEGQAAAGWYTSGSGFSTVAAAAVYETVTVTLQWSPNEAVAGVSVMFLILVGTYWFLPRESNEAVVAVVEELEELETSELSAGAKVRVIWPMFWNVIMPMAVLVLFSCLTMEVSLPAINFDLPFTRSITPFPDLFNRLFPTSDIFYPTSIFVLSVSVFLGNLFVSFTKIILSVWAQAVAVMLISMVLLLVGSTLGPLLVVGLAMVTGLLCGSAFNSTFQSVSECIQEGVLEAFERERDTRGSILVRRPSLLHAGGGGRVDEETGLLDTVGSVVEAVKMEVEETSRKVDERVQKEVRGHQIDALLLTLGLAGMLAGVAVTLKHRP